MAPKEGAWWPFPPVNQIDAQLQVMFESDRQMQKDQETKSEMDKALMLYNRAMELRADSKFAEAIPFFTQAAGSHERVYGAEHPFTMHANSAWGLCLTEAGKPAEGEVLLRQAVGNLSKKLGPEHAQSLAAINNLALCLKAQNRPGEAAPLFRQALEASEKHRGNTDINTLHIKNNLSICLSDMGQPQLAEPLIRETLYYFEMKWGHRSFENRKTLYFSHNLATCLDAQHKNEEAEMYYKRAMGGFMKILGNQHEATVQCAANLAVMYDLIGRGGEAYGLRKMFGMI